jgi:hypothetical protein
LPEPAVAKRLSNEARLIEQFISVEHAFLVPWSPVVAKSELQPFPPP